MSNSTGINKNVILVMMTMDPDEKTIMCTAYPASTFAVVLVFTVVFVVSLFVFVSLFVSLFVFFAYAPSVCRANC